MDEATSSAGRSTAGCQAAATWSEKSGVGLSFLHIAGLPRATELRRIVDGLLAARPNVDAIVCLPEGLGVGILSTLRELDRAVPGDIQVVSYVDSGTLPIVQPPISALDLRPREAGMRAGQLLVGLLDEQDAEPRARVETFDLIFRERGSTRAVDESSGDREKGEALTDQGLDRADDAADKVTGGTFDKQAGSSRDAGDRKLGQ